MITFVSTFFLLPLFSFGTIILLLSGIMTTPMETKSYAQLLPETDNNGNATNTLPSSLPSVQAKLHMVKITSPAKGQQIPVRTSR